jgi:hypothetical protein
MDKNVHAGTGNGVHVVCRSQLTGGISLQLNENTAAGILVMNFQVTFSFLERRKKLTNTSLYISLSISLCMIVTMEQITIQTPNLKCRLYWCLIEFIDL